MEAADRLKLAKEVFDKVFQHSDKFRENNLGADLCYLLGAILDTDEPQAFVDWNEDCDETLALFQQLFHSDHDVWRFIEWSGQYMNPYLTTPQ